VAHVHDDGAFERVANRPTRGIGERTLEAIRARARAEATSLWAAADAVRADQGLSARAANAVGAFTALIEKLGEELNGLGLREQVERTLQRSGLIRLYEQETGEQARNRLENLEELVNAAQQFAEQEVAGAQALTEFLAHAALESGEAQGGAFEDCVQLMTLHAAKGLEFPLVLLCGMEEGLFPHQLSLQDPGRLEEERRLCYVGMTRAMQELYLCYAEQRRLHGQERFGRPSRFLQEIPARHLEALRMKGSVTLPLSRKGEAAADTTAGTVYPPGRRVRHPSFGEGVVLAYEGQGDHLRVQVNFEQRGAKWLVAAYAKLEQL
jgi:DNA helicase-2/ATP-dependent DNA helicase PcrA